MFYYGASLTFDVT